MILMMMKVVMILMILEVTMIDDSDSDDEILRFGTTPCQHLSIIFFGLEIQR